MNREYTRKPVSSKHSEEISSLISSAEVSVCDSLPAEGIPGGDMPGDRIDLNEKAVAAAKKLYPSLSPLLSEAAAKNPYGRVIVSISGGSGSGKTCFAALLAYILKSAGVGAYTMSGDNYVHVIPAENDVNRLRIFRHNGVRAIVESGLASPEVFDRLREFQRLENNTGHAEPIDEPWFSAYIQGGKAALNRHLGSPHEQNYGEINDILNAFRDGASSIWLRRMGRDNTAFWYEEKDFSGIDVLILEWTHGLSHYLSGIDLKLFINTTPEETYASRVARGRDNNTQSDLIQAVIAIEQQQLIAEVPHANVISTRSGELLSIEEWRKLQ